MPPPPPPQLANALGVQSVDQACTRVASSLWPNSKLIRGARTLHSVQKPAFIKKVLTQLALLITVGDCIRDTGCVAVYLVGGLSMEKDLSNKAKVSAFCRAVRDAAAANPSLTAVHKCLRYIVHAGDQDCQIQPKVGLLTNMFRPGKFVFGDPVSVPPTTGPVRFGAGCTRMREVSFRATGGATTTLQWYYEEGGGEVEGSTCMHALLPLITKKGIGGAELLNWGLTRAPPYVDRWRAASQILHLLVCYWLAKLLDDALFLTVVYVPYALQGFLISLRFVPSSTHEDIVYDHHGESVTLTALHPCDNLWQLHSDGRMSTLVLFMAAGSARQHFPALSTPQEQQQVQPLAVVASDRDKEGGGEKKRRREEVVSSESCSSESESEKEEADTTSRSFFLSEEAEEGEED